MSARAVDTVSLPQDTVEASIKFIAENLREADREELHSSTGLSSTEGLMESWKVSSHCWLILDNEGLPIGIFGAAPHPVEGLGVVWMMGTDGILKEAISVARQTRRYVDEMQAVYPTLWNFVDARNELSIRWLTWSGFRLVDVDPFHGRDGQTFIEFVRSPYV